jgi:adhesin transport system outer membrane protein
MIWGVGQTRAETLQDAVHYMLQTHPQVRAQSWNRLARDEEVKQARADYLPTLDVQYSLGYNDEDEPDNITSHPKQTVLSLRQNVFRGFRTKNEVERQKYRVNSSAFRLQGVAEGIALDTSKVYLNVLRQLEILDLAKENVVTHQRIFDQIKLRSESGIDSKADLDQVKARLALAESDVVVTKANVADAETEYKFTVGHTPEDLIKPYSVDALMPVSLDEAEQVAVASHPILKSAQADVDAREAQYDVAKGNYYPILDLTADKKWEEDVDVPGSAEELSAAAVVRFNIFRGWWDKARIAETRKLICEAVEIRNNTHREIIESVRLAWVAYQAAINQIIFLESYVDSTSVTAESFNKQWNIGRRTMFDVLDIEAELINAKIDLVNARYDKLYAQYRILKDLNRLVEALGLQMPVESRVDEPQQMQETPSTGG